MTTGNGYRSLPQSMIINTTALPLSLKASCAWLPSMQKYPQKTVNELIIDAQTADSCYRLITIRGEIEFWIVLFCFPPFESISMLTQSGVHGRRSDVSLFLPLQIRGIKLCMNECFQTSVDLTTMNTDDIHLPSIPSLSISAPVDSFTACSRLLPHYSSSSVPYSPAEGPLSPPHSLPGPVLTEIISSFYFLNHFWG